MYCEGFCKEFCKSFLENSFVQPFGRGPFITQVQLIYPHQTYPMCISMVVWVWYDCFFGWWPKNHWCIEFYFWNSAGLTTQTQLDGGPGVLFLVKVVPGSNAMLTCSDMTSMTSITSMGSTGRGAWGLEGLLWRQSLAPAQCWLAAASLSSSHSSRTLWLKYLWLTFSPKANINVFILIGILIGSERSLRNADVVSLWVCGWVCLSPLCSTALLRGS